ncbi:SIMPL domain-containing protein [Luteibacter sp. dw_328]|uniref:SIMPL domain-containing protein n=1 Tax=Luteibacter sp. dw_328 TaxID=2719796 RepID=UPI001BD6802D|nr:SIMPL domain-containing protein [Luteibacter sp. dw_328]
MNRYLLAVALAALPVLASASETPSSPYLSAKGHAERSVQPDRFGIDLRVIAVDMKPAVARTRVEKLMAGVLAGFKAHHAIPESIDATAISVDAKSEYRDDKDAFLGTQVSRTAHAVFANLDDLRQFIDGVEADQELQITGTTVTRSDIEAVRQDVRRDAIKDSIRSAKAMADAYGVKLGTLYTVTDSPAYVGGRSDLSSVTVTAATLPKIDLQVGSIKVEENVFAIFFMDTGK